MTSVEIHVPASPTPAFANMLYFLTASLDAVAAFPGPWRLVITLGHDGPLTPDARAFDWAANYPVEFRQVAPALWAEYTDPPRKGHPAYHATIRHQFGYEYPADVTIFMDADTVVTRPLGPLVERVAAAQTMAAKPAWQPPPQDLSAVCAAVGLPEPKPVMEYSGWGWSFLEPRLGPPYLNGGFITSARSVTQAMMPGLERDYRALAGQFPGHYLFQVLHCVTILRDDLPWEPLDERYNMGIGPADPPILGGDEGARLEALGWEQFYDAHIVHYCTPTANFRRNDVMADDRLLAAFLQAEGLTEGEELLRGAFAAHAGPWRALKGL